MALSNEVTDDRWPDTTTHASSIGSSDAPIKVDVVVLTWNDGAVLTEAIDSALASVGVSVTVWVVDNGSDPPATVPRDERVVLVRNAANRGVAAARNQGVHLGATQVVCLLDSDARLEPDALARLAGLVIDGEFGCVGPVFVGQRPEASGGRAPTPWRKVQRVLGRTDLYGSTPRRHRPVWDVDFVIGACQVFSRRAYDSIGGIDQRYFYGPEDVDFCLRLRESGWRVGQCGEAAVHHPPRRRHRRLLTRAGARHAWAVVQFLWRHRGFDRRGAGVGAGAWVAEPTASR